MSSGDDPANTRSPARGPLAELLDHIAAQAPHKYARAQRIDKKETPGMRTVALPGNFLRGEPPEVEYFQKTWAKASTGLRLRQSQQHVPENAGPLNSSQLIHRALLLMQDRSPAYLQHFLSYVDTLSWMDQLHASASSPSTKTASKVPMKIPAKTPSKAAGAKKPPRKAR